MLLLILLTPPSHPAIVVLCTKPNTLVQTTGPAWALILRGVRVGDQMSLVYDGYLYTEIQEIFSLFCLHIISKPMSHKVNRINVMQSACAIPLFNFANISSKQTCLSSDIKHGLNTRTPRHKGTELLSPWEGVVGV